MTARAPFTYPRFQAFDANGNPLANGTVEFFDAGTTNNRDVYSDPDLTTKAPNPVDLNSRGEPESGGGSPVDIYFDGKPYKIVLKDSDGVTVATIDDYVAPPVVPSGGEISPTVSTLSDLQNVTAGAYDFIYMGGRSSKGDGGEGWFKWDGSDLSTEVGNDTEKAIYVPPDSDTTGASGAWVKQSGLIDKDVTIGIPSTYSTLQKAIDDLSKFKPLNGVTITLNIESGHNLTKGLTVEKGHYSHFRITSDDSEVSLDGSFTPATTPSSESFSETENPVFSAVEAHAPIWEILVNANNGDSTLAGYSLIRSVGTITDGSGVKNTGQMGLIVSYSSTVRGRASVFSGAGRGNRITSASKGDLRGADLSNSQVNAGSRAALDVSRSSFCTIASNSTQTPTDLSGAAGDALNVRRSFVSATYANVSGAGEMGVNAQLGSWVAANNIDADNCGNRAIRARDGSHVDATDGTLTNATNESVFAARGSTVSVVDADCSNQGATNSIEVFNGSTVSANGAVLSATFNVTGNRLTTNGIVYTDNSEIPPDSSSDQTTLGFGTFREPNSDRPTLVTVDVNVETDGSTDGRAAFQVAESGSVSADYSFNIIQPSQNTSGNSVNREVLTHLVPAGASYRIVNLDDPNNANEVREIREHTL